MSPCFPCRFSNLKQNEKEPRASSLESPSFRVNSVVGDRHLLWMSMEVAMSPSPRPAPHPGNAEQPTTSPRAMPETTHPTPAIDSNPAQSASEPMEQTAPTSQLPQEEKSRRTRAKPCATPPPLKLTPLPLNLDVRRWRLDPFMMGVIVGAIAALVGLLVGLYVLVLN